MKSTLEEIRRLRRLSRRNLWGIGGEERNETKSYSLNVVRTVLMTVEQYQTNRLAIHASGLSFFMLLSLVPLLAFLFVILKVFKVADLVKPFLLEMVTGGNALLVERISEYIESTKSLGLGGVGLLTLFLIGFLVLQRVKTTLNAIWRVAHRPGYAYRFIEYVTILTVTPLLLVATFSFSAVVRGVYESQVFREWSYFSGFGLPIAGISQYLVLWLVVYYAYTYLPDTKVRWYSAVVGTVLSGSGLTIAQKFYILVIVEVSNYNLVYGALALLPFLMVWFYVAWTIFLFGAQMSCVVQNFNLYVEQRRHIGRRMGSTVPYLGLLALAGVMRLMRATGTAPTIREITKDTELPRGVVEEALKRLVEARLLTPVVDEGERFTPQEVLEPLTVKSVIERLGVMPGFRDPPPGWQNTGSVGLSDLFFEANEALTVPLANKTMAELVKELEKDSFPESSQQAEGAEPATQGQKPGSGKTPYREEGAFSGSGTSALLRKK